MKHISKLLSGLVILALLTMSTASAGILNRNINVIVDGDFEKSGVASFTGQNGATLTKVAGAGNITGSQYLRIESSGSANARAVTSFFAIAGQTYRFRGQCRSDATSSARFNYVGFSVSDVVPCPAGTADFGFFDYTETAIYSGSIALVNYLGTTGWTEWDNVSITRVNGMIQDRTQQLYIDGDMEKAGTANWSCGSCTSSKVAKFATTEPGTQAFRMTKTGAGTGFSSFSGLTAGVPHRLTGWTRGDGTSVPYATFNFGGSFIFTGTSSTSPQKIDVIFTPGAGNTILTLYAISGTTGNYVEWDNLTLTKLNGLVQNRSAELITNGDGEAGTAGWTAGAGGVVSSQTGANDLQGSKVIRLTNNGSATTTMTNTKYIYDANTKYRFTGSVKCNSANMRPVWYILSDTTLYPFYGAKTTATQYFANEITTGANTNASVIYQSEDGGGTSGYCEWDNITASKIY